MKKPIIIAIIGIIIGLIGVYIYKQYEYSKYCINCESRYVTFSDLEEIKLKREAKAIENINYLKDNISGYRALIYEDSLNSEEKKKFNEFQVKQVYDENTYYKIDELIKIETDYEKVGKEVKELYINSTIRMNKEEITDSLKQINEDMKIIENKNLDGYQEKNYAKYKSELKATDYDENKDYTVSEIEKITKKINQLKRHFNTLAN